MRIPTEKSFNITTEFGVKDPNAFFGFHSGIDFAAPAGSAVVAPASGQIWWAGFSQTGGNMIILFDGTYYHRLMHNTRMYVVSGDRVVEGQHIADSGSTGLAFGPHVHWDVATEMLAALRPSAFNKFVNPLGLVGGKGGEEMTAEQQALFTKGQLLNGMQPLGEGTIVMRAKLPLVQIWDLQSSPNFQSRGTYSQGDLFEVVAFIDAYNSRYYVSLPDALRGRPYGVNSRDVEIASQYRIEDVRNQLTGLQAAATELQQRPTQENFNALKLELSKSQEQLQTTRQQLQTVEATQKADSEAGDTFLRRFGQFVRKFLP